MNNLHELYIEKSGSVRTGKSHAFDNNRGGSGGGGGGGGGKHDDGDRHDDDDRRRHDDWYRRRYYYDRPEFLQYVHRPYYISTFWQMIFNVVMNYPTIPSEYEKEKMKMFISTLPMITPCYSDACKAYVKNYVNFINIDDVTRDHNSIYDFFYTFRTHMIELFGKEIADADEFHYYHGVS